MFSTLRTVQATAAVVAVVALGPGIVAASRHLADAAGGAAAPAAIAALTSAASIVIAWRARIMGEALVALLLSLLAAQGAVAAAHSMNLRPPWLPAGTPESSYRLLAILLWAAANFTAVRMMQRFPRPVDPAAFSAASTWHRALIALLDPWWLLLLSAALLLAGLGGAWIVGNLIVALLALSYGHTSFRTADEAGRRKLFWMLFTGVVFLTLSVIWLGLSAVIAALGWPADTKVAVGHIWSIAVALVGLTGLSLAIWAPAALDPRPWIRHTALYGLVATALLFSFALIENLVSDVVLQALGVGGTTVSSVVGAALALLLQPLHKRLDTWSGKRVPDAHRSSAAGEQTVV